uniref:Uncharacterized protein n=1 Tax=Arundo donax TaxID=35708 RepID=A0A0A9DAZ4_ARUDO
MSPSRSTLLDLMSRCTIRGTQSWWRYSTPCARPAATLSRASQLSTRFLRSPPAPPCSQS